MTGARHNIKPYQLTALAEHTINVTGPDARNLKTPRGWVQGYNAQAVVTRKQIIVAAEISTESRDTANLHQMLTAAEEELHDAGINDKLAIVLADAGYWKNTAVETLAEQGLQPLVAPDADRRKEPRQADAADSMTSCAASSQPSTAPRSTGNAKRSSSPSSDRSKPTRRRPIPAPRPLSRQIRMAPTRGHPQPAQAPPTPPRHRLTASARRSR
jgi:hypothetical protein